MSHKWWPYLPITTTKKRYVDMRMTNSIWWCSTKVNWWNGSKWKRNISVWSTTGVQREGKSQLVMMMMMEWGENGAKSGGTFLRVLIEFRQGRRSSMNSPYLSSISSVWIVAQTVETMERQRKKKGKRSTGKIRWSAVLFLFFGFVPFFCLFSPLNRSRPESEERRGASPRIQGRNSRYVDRKTNILAQRRPNQWRSQSEKGTHDNGVDLHPSFNGICYWYNVF